ncbi:MAG: hypothetical protein HYS18_08135 [Burkholderiales bacterium]|nr:hypothetical protein [Burkholderiales bacterium]
MSAIAGFATVILLVRHMNVPAYAGYAAIIGLTVIAGMLAGLGMERALTRFIPEGHLHHPPRQLSRFIWLTTALRLAVMSLVVAGMYFSWPQLAAQFSGLVGKMPLGAIFLIVGTAMFQLLSAVMQALVQQKTLTRVMVVQWGGRLLLILALIMTHSEISLEQAIWLMAIPDCIGSLILAVVVQRYLSKRAANGRYMPPAKECWPPWREVGRLSLNNYGYNLLAALPQGSAMIVLAAALLAAPFVAAYGFFINLIDRIKQYLPLQFMLNLAEPVLIAGYVKDQDFGRLCHHNRLLYQVNLLLLMPALAWLASVAPQMTSLLTGGRYADHAWILPVLILQLALGSHATIIQIVINAVGKSEVLAISGASALISMAAAIALMIVSGHAGWIAVAPLVYEMVNNGVAVAGLRSRGFDYSPHWRFHAKLLAATGLAWISADFSAAHVDAPLAQIFIAGLTALFGFAAAILLLRAFDSGDVHTLKELLRKEREK